MVEYKEYMDALEPQQDESEEAAASDGSTDGDSGNSSAEEGESAAAAGARTALRVEPYGAEEIREEMVRRKQAEQARVREERIRRQAYKEQLDVKVFEEELEASKSRKGGANPAITNTEAEGEIPETRITDFKFDTNQHPLRFTATGKSDFIPIFSGTAAEPPLKPFEGCPKGHKELSDFQSGWWNCSNCSSMGVQFMCWQCYNSGPYWACCKKCVDGHRKAQERDRRDPAKHPTFLRCMTQCSFSVQVSPHWLTRSLARLCAAFHPSCCVVK